MFACCGNGGNTFGSTFGSTMAKHPPYLFKKRGIYFFQKRISHLFIPAVGRSVITKYSKTDAIRLRDFMSGKGETKQQLQKWEVLRPRAPATAIGA